MRLLSLEIAEPGATKSQIDQKSCDQIRSNPKCPVISWEGRSHESGVGSRGGDRCRESRDSGAKLCAGCDDRPLAENASFVRHGDYTLILKRVQLSVSELAILAEFANRSE